MRPDTLVPLAPVPRRVTVDHLREALCELAQQRAQILTHSEKSWASITFAGARHRLALNFEGLEAVAAGELFVAELAEHEFEIPGQLVAEAAVTEVEHRLDPPRMFVVCELLLLDEG